MEARIKECDLDRLQFLASFLPVPVAPVPVAISIQAMWIAVAVVNRNAVANVCAVKVRRGRRQALIRVGRVAVLLGTWGGRPTTSLIGAVVAGRVLVARGAVVGAMVVVVVVATVGEGRASCSSSVGDEQEASMRAPATIRFRTRPCVAAMGLLGPVGHVRLHRRVRMALWTKP